MTEDARDTARKLAHDAAPGLVRELIGIAKNRRPARNANARTAAIRLALDVSGLTGAAAQIDAFEKLCKRLEPLMSESAYAELIDALAQLQGVATDGTPSDSPGSSETPAR